MGISVGGTWQSVFAVCCRRPLVAGNHPVVQSTLVTRLAFAGSCASGYPEAQFSSAGAPVGRCTGTVWAPDGATVELARKNFVPWPGVAGIDLQCA